MENLLNISPVVGAVIPLTLGLTQVIKTAVKLDKRFVPLVSVLMGVALCVPALFLLEQNPYLGIFGGIIAGLSACGLWSGVKATSGR
jgi:hypothetical protein